MNATRWASRFWLKYDLLYGVDTGKKDSSCLVFSYRLNSTEGRFIALRSWIKGEKNQGEHSAFTLMFHP